SVPADDLAGQRPEREPVSGQHRRDEPGLVGGEAEGALERNRRDGVDEVGAGVREDVLAQRVEHQIGEGRALPEAGAAVDEPVEPERAEEIDPVADHVVRAQRGRQHGADGQRGDERGREPPGERRGG
ncbi:MAG: hypothetical protein ACK559_18095, partial [bacterium]